MRRAGGLAIRKVLGKLLTVERAANVHRVPLDEFLTMVREAVGQRQRADELPAARGRTARLRPVEVGEALIPPGPALYSLGLVVSWAISGR